MKNKNNKNVLWILILAVIVVLVVVFFVTKPSFQNKNISSGNLCEQVVSLADVKNICSSGFMIEDVPNESFYAMPNDSNIIHGSWGDQIQILTPSGVATSLAIQNGTKSICSKAINNGITSYDFTVNNDSRYLTIQVYEYNSPKYALEAYDWFNSFDTNVTISNESGSSYPYIFDKGNNIGENYFLLAFRGGEQYDNVSNQTANMVKSTTFEFLKSDKIVIITEYSYLPDKDLICSVDQIKKLASTIDKKI